MKKLHGALPVAAVALAVAWGAHAASPQQQQAAYPPAASGAVALGETKTPIGWVDFCIRYSRDCEASANSGGRELQLTPQAWKLIVTINARVNASIEPVTDNEHWGVAERWDYAEDGKGDCEDYVLLKRRMLVQAGVPRQALLITIVRDRKDEGHAVLTVKTDRGDFVLDNQEERVLAWQATGYRFVKRQSQQNHNRWVDLQNVPAPVSTAAR
jgi:predicted transglutaminase-like cysteine proteinase